MKNSEQVELNFREATSSLVELKQRVDIVMKRLEGHSLTSDDVSSLANQFEEALAKVSDRASW